jgi:hypothetical protein
VTLRTLRALTAAFFLCFAALVTWPGYVPFNRVEPLILGLPFSMAWIALWVVLSAVALYLLDRAEQRKRED